MRTGTCAKMARKPLQTFDVFVGNLPNDANERNVGKVFTPYGEIAGIIVKESPKVPPPYNKYAFVKFLCEPDAEKAVKELDKTNIQGSSIVVKKADDRKDLKKKSFGEGAGRRGFRQSDTGNLDSNAGEWTCPKLECANINFSRRTSCNLCGTPRPEGSICSDSSDVGVISGPGSIVEQELDTVLITHVETPVTLWIQVVSDENTKKIFSITEQLIQLCPAAQPVSGQPDSGKVYACLFSEDNMWYRCQVKQNLGTDKFKIQYIDYGNTEEVALGSLVELPASVANVKGLACKIQLHNTRAKDRSDKQGILFLKSLTDNKMAQLVRTRPLADGSGYYGDLIVNNFSLSDSMIQAGYCHSRPVMGKQGLMTRQPQNDTCMFPEVPTHQQLAMSFSSVTKPQRDHRTMSPLGQPPSIIGQPSAPPSVGPTQVPNMGFPMPINPPDHGREKKLQNQLTRKNHEIERMRNEIDAAKMQAEYMRSKVKTLQEEFAASASRLQEDTMSKRINTAVALAGVVRNLREQFPTNMAPCLLEDAIALSMDKDRVDNSKCPSLGDVSTSLARYRAAQDEISKCKEQSELLDLIDTRNDSRRDLYKSLSTCLKEMEQLPLKTRSKQVQETQLRLLNTYSEYMKHQVHDVPSIENLAPGFKAWKGKKDTEFRDIRTATDFCEGALQTALNQVKERVSVQTSSRTEKCDVDIDDLFKTYSHALQREINVTDMVHGKDASQVATLIASVRKELQSEETTLENFSVLHQEFSSRKQTIEPWLDKTPSFSELQEIRKQIRSLKSKLRHIQADKLDLEESGDERELDSIKEEEDKVRTSLQTALLQSDNLLEEVAMLADSNFPELVLQFPDFGIDTFLAYKGLVKTNREIDHYCLQPGFRPGVHISNYNEEPVLLQEFHIGDSEHCSKEEFMSQLCHYNRDTNMVQAVFFSKSDRLAYVQSHWDGGQVMEAVVNSRQFTSEQLHKVCLRLTEQVVQIHASGCIHGEITPQSVILREDNSVMLMYPDFSKQPCDRISKRYVAEGGLVFQTPELQYTSPEILGQTADVYNLVLLMFWLYCPNHKPSSLPNGGPSLVDLSPKMQQLFDAVISGKTATQLHANQVLTILQESSPVQTEQSDFIPVPSAESVMVPQPQVIRSTNEPMEIGVFRAEDYIMEQDILPPQPERIVNTALDTDNSWTTESSLSGTSGSRGDSPQGDSPIDNTDLEVNTCSDSLQSVSVDTVRTDRSKTQFSGNVSDTMAAVQTCYIQTDSAQNTSSEIPHIEPIAGVTEKGAACEQTEKTEDATC